MENGVLVAWNSTAYDGVEISEIQNPRLEIEKRRVF